MSPNGTTTHTQPPAAFQPFSAPSTSSCARSWGLRQTSRPTRLEPVGRQQVEIPRGDQPPRRTLARIGSGSPGRHIRDEHLVAHEDHHLRMLLSPEGRSPQPTARSNNGEDEPPPATHRPKRYSSICDLSRADSARHSIDSFIRMSLTPFLTDVAEVHERLPL